MQNNKTIFFLVKKIILIMLVNQVHFISSLFYFYSEKRIKYIKNFI